MLVSPRFSLWLGVFATLSCSAPAPDGSSPPKLPEQAEQTTAPTAGADQTGAAPNACADDDMQDLDLSRLLSLAQASIRARTSAPIGDCSAPAPRCAATPDGASCVYAVHRSPQVLRVTLWPPAVDGGVVEATALVAPDLSGTVADAEVETHRWAVAGPLRCRGESHRRSYSARTPAPTIGQLGIFCFNGGDEAVPLHLSSVARSAPTPAPVSGGQLVPGTVPPRSETTLELRFDPVELVARERNAFDIRLTAGSRTLRPVAQVTVPERIPR